MTEIKFIEDCPKCKQKTQGEMRGDDSCRYFWFVCQPCNKKWTRNAPSVRK
jgi:transposase-like protein